MGFMSGKVTSQDERGIGEKGGFRRLRRFSHRATSSLAEAPHRTYLTEFYEA
jgi:hypothetical protein